MRTDAKPIFLDTNILLAATDTSRSAHTDCDTLLESGFKGTCSLFTNAQVFREYLVVATRPHEVNGLGMDPIQALENIASFQQCIQVLEETVQVSNRLLNLYQRLSLRGNKILYSLAVVGTPAPAERMCVNLSNLGRSPSAPDGN